MEKILKTPGKFLPLGLEPHWLFQRPDLNVPRMQHALSLAPCFSSPEFDVDPVFKVVIVYEDFDTGRHAKRTYDFLAANLGRECENQMWKFEVLSIPKLREIAGTDAAAADIVVISCHGDELPEHVRAWTEAWLSQEIKPLALVALFDRPREEAHRTRPVRDYLAAAAQRARIEFFAQPDQWPGQNRHSEAQEGECEGDLDQRALSALAGVVQQDFIASRWGVFE